MSTSPPPSTSKKQELKFLSIKIIDTPAAKTGKIIISNPLVNNMPQQNKVVDLSVHPLLIPN